MDSFGIVLSNQVIEHMHPDDLVDHFRNVRLILKSGGKYIFTTPNKYAGPSDISYVFNCDTPKGMHLKEYTNLEIKKMLNHAGFNSIKAVWKVPDKVSSILRIKIKPIASSYYLSYLCLIEKLISKLPTQKLRRKSVILSRLIFFTPSIFIIAKK